MKFYGYLAAMCLTYMLTGWYFFGMVSDLMGYNILDPRKHLNLYELMWALVFGALACYFTIKVRTLKPAKPRHHSTKN